MSGSLSRMHNCSFLVLVALALMGCSQVSDAASTAADSHGAEAIRRAGRLAAAQDTGRT